RHRRVARGGVGRARVGRGLVAAGVGGDARTGVLLDEVGGRAVAAATEDQRGQDEREGAVGHPPSVRLVAPSIEETPAIRAAFSTFSSRFACTSMRTRGAWGDPAPCIDSVRSATAVGPSVMFSMSRRTRTRSSAVPRAPVTYFLRSSPYSG